MNLRAAILKEHSKQQTLLVTDYIGDSSKRFEVAMQLFFEGSLKETQRISWVISHTIDRHPELILPYLEPFIRNLRNPVHDAVKRNTVRVLQNINVPQELRGELFDLCYGFLTSMKEPVAIKAFSMTVLYNIGKHEPDLLAELRLVLEDQFPHGSAGFKSRARKVIKLIDESGM